MSREKTLEKRLREEAKKRGGIALKIFSYTFTGMPDRMVLLPGAGIGFAEIKSAGKKPTPRQTVVIRFLKKLGFLTMVIDSDELLDEFFKRLQC